MKKMSCEIVISPNASQHLSQIITGFIMLKRQNSIDLKVTFSNDSLTSMVEVIVNKEKRIAYDMADGYHFDLERVQSFFKRIDYIFKRSFKASDHSSFDFSQKVFPLGLNYHVTTKDNPMDAPINKSITEKMKWYIKEFQNKNYHQQFYVEAFEDKPKLENTQPLILFSVRTWGKDEGADLDENETNAINETRAKCIRMLRGRFGESFVGGFSKRREATELYPDCVIDDNVTKRENYVKMVKNADICISTIGLHKSNGWKLGEYVAASKAIVGEKLYYDVPNFEKDVNYLEFVTPEECVIQAEKLVNDKERLLEMKRNNFHYYNNYLRPDKLVLSSLIEAGCEL